MLNPFSSTVTPLACKRDAGSVTSSQPHHSTQHQDEWAMGGLMWHEKGALNDATNMIYFYSFILF